MRTAITRVAGSVVLVLTATGIVFVTGMRAKSPVVVNGVRRLGRAMRPLAIKSAGGVGASASVIHHVGRTSGRAYATPVGAVPIDEGFVIALPYGLSADWLQNVLASGSATIAHDGSTYDVDRPEVVPLSAVGDQFSPPINGLTACSGSTSVSVSGDESASSRPTPSRPERTNDTPPVSRPAGPSCRSGAAEDTRRRCSARPFGAGASRARRHRHR